MKEGEKQRRFHEALLKMMYPPRSQDEEEEDEKEENEVETVLIDSLNDPLEEKEDIENDRPSPSCSDDNDGGDGKLTRAQRKRLRKKKLKEAASRRRKIIGPLLPDSNEYADHSYGGTIEATSNVAEDVRRNAPTREEASCSNKNKNKLKMKQRRNSKKISVAKSTASSTSNQNQDPK